MIQIKSYFTQWYQPEKCNCRVSFSFIDYEYLWDYSYCQPIVLVDVFILIEDILLTTSHFKSKSTNSTNPNPYLTVYLYSTNTLMRVNWHVSLSASDAGWLAYKAHKMGNP